MTIIRPWSISKNYINNINQNTTYIDDGDSYSIFIKVNNIILETRIIKDSGSDQNNFETNYKSLILNKELNIIDASPPFGAKTITIGGVTKKLFARFTGLQQSLDAGDNTIDYTATYSWAKIIGLEVINGEPLDKADLKIFDTATGTYSGVPNYCLNQFAYTLNIAKDYYLKMAQFDADIYPGMILRFTYNSVSAKTVGINLLMNEVKT